MRLVANGRAGYAVLPPKARGTARAVPLVVTLQSSLRYLSHPLRRKYQNGMATEISISRIENW